jgi:hypothetical protein
MPGSSESGAVPITRVTVPPFFGADADVVVFAVVVELDELPQALSATAVAAVRSKASVDLECLFTTSPPLPEVGVPVAQ